MGRIFILQLLFVLILCNISRTLTSCVNDNNEHRCSSLDDLTTIDHHSDWTKLQLSNSGSENLKPITANKFKNLPNLDYMKIHRLINGIEFNAFKGLERLSTLHLEGNSLPEIKIGMLSNLPIKTLILYTSSVKFLRPRSFDQLPNLEAIYIHKNQIDRIESNVFSYNTRITILLLNENAISVIEPEAFFGMENLYQLGLERNFLKSFEPQFYIGSTSPNLRILWLARNNLTVISSNSYVAFPEMRILLMHLNTIRKVEVDGFKGIEKLKYLDLSNNELQTLDPGMFGNGLPVLDKLLIHNNHLTYVPTATLNKLDRLNEISIGGNPFNCICYKKLRTELTQKNVKLICNDEYVNGMRPICVTPEKQINQCDESLDNVDKYVRLYQETSQDYLKLPPMCKIFCDIGKPCFSHDFDILVYS